jgi:uncharacterized protein
LELQPARQFEWDETKNQTNIAKHGIEFEAASKIFERPRVAWQDGRQEYGEVRMQTIGKSDE